MEDDMVTGEIVEIKDDGEKKCVLCDKVWGVFGLLLGGVFLFISIDVLFGGVLSNMISNRREEETE